MQIKNIILYKDAEHQRVLSFELGKVNIITGESKSGKTALINIVDYCLGSRECKIADGVIMFIGLLLLLFLRIKNNIL